MIISVNSGSKGWANYVIEGTKEKSRDKSKVYILDGDLELGDFLCKQNKYEDSYYSIVLGVKGIPTDEVIEEVYKDFKRHFFQGLYKDEYHIDAVVHKDTDNYHVHVRVPKQNLLTNTHLQLYYDKVDRKRKELIQDYISLKHGFEIARETNKKVLMIGNKTIDSIDKWREKYKKEPFHFKSKKNRKNSEEIVNEYLNELHKKGYIKSQKDIEEELKELGLKVERFGKDLKKDFSYVTVSNETGKMRIKGEFYSSEFFENTFDERSEQIESNCKEFNVVNNRFTEVKKSLEKENIKRIGRVNQLFSTKRKKIKEEHQDLISQGKQEISGNQEISNEKGVNSDYIRTTVAQGVTRERKVKYRAYKQASESRRTVFGNIKECFETARRTQQSNLSKIAEIGKLLFKYLTKKIKLNSSELVIQNELENNIAIENISTNVKRKNRR